MADLNKVEIKNADRETIDDLIAICIPPDKRGDELFIKGMEVKKRWADQVMKRYGGFAKVAYLNGRPAGVIQYLPRSDEKVVEILCIFVPRNEDVKKGVGRRLLFSLIDEMKEAKPYFDYERPLALITWAFQVPGRYPQHEFYKKMGFKQVSEDDPLLLYYPLVPDYRYEPEKKEYIPQKEDMGKALIFYDPSCPFCLYFSQRIKDSITEVAPDIHVEMINQFENHDEVKKREKVSFCIVNQKIIGSFFMDKVNFQKEVLEALKK